MICLHSASTAASSSAAGTTSLTMPASRARAGRAVAEGLAPHEEPPAAPARAEVVGVRAGAKEELGQFNRHGVGGGVSNLRPIERDFQPRSLAGGENVAGHAFASQSAFAAERKPRAENASTQ